MRLIGISGKKRSGKDTICRILLPKLRALGLGPWNQVAFAEPVKNILSGIFGVSREWIEEWKVRDEIPEGWEMTVREALINIGDRFREIKKSVWRDRAFNLPGNKVITDLRYKNEAWAAHKLGLIVRVYRPGLETLDNPSETDLDEYDKICLAGELEGEINIPEIPYHFFLLNNGGVWDLKKKVEDVLFPGVERSLKFFTS